MSLTEVDRYVKSLFDGHPEHAREYGFREKYGHTKRVYGWAKRLLRTEPADCDIVLCAALFHDVGYVVCPDEHPRHSAVICGQYLAEHGFDERFVKRVTDCIVHHDNKELLFDEKTDRETILLIEADNLDESGALSVLRDALSEGASGNAGYLKTFRRLLERRIVRQPNDFLCVTETAKKIWREKQRLYLTLIESLKTDLDIDSNIDLVINGIER